MAGAKELGIESIEIEKFRKFKPMTIPIGRYVTVISGQNGTGKSTPLGMLGQPFGLEGAKSIFGKVMRAKFTDIFKLSPGKDIPGEHVYFVNLRDKELYNGETRVQVKSYPRKDYPKLPIRIVTGAKREKGDGNIDFPVIYLGLKRTYPVGEIPNVTSADAPLTEEEADLFIAWYSKVFLSWNQGDITPVELGKNSVKKSTLLVNAEEYDFLANSAGQDNLGQILGALISFKRVKEEIGDEYRGGMLLVDELDATLFPASQEAIFDLFIEAAKQLKIQVVFTTHSFSLLERAMSYKGKHGDVEVVYLRRRSSGIEIVGDPTMDDVRADLNVRRQPSAPKVKAEVWCEDDEAAWLLRHILPQNVASKCKIIAARLSCGELAELSTRDIDSLKDVTFVVDGDAVKSASKKIRESKNLCILPTGDRNPERAIYDDLMALPDDGSFWGEMEKKNRYTQQMFMRSFEESHTDHRPFEDLNKDARKKARVEDKAWFKKEKGRGGWGANGTDFINQWKELHAVEVASFVEDFSTKVDRVIRRVSAMAKRPQD